jgi:pyruvate kinase
VHGLTPTETAAGLHAAVLGLRAHALAAEAAGSAAVAAAHPQWRPSLVNLLHYLAVRQHDLRPLQAELSLLGLSSLGRLEAHVLATLDAVLARLQDMLTAAGSPTGTDRATAVLSHPDGARLLREHARAALGPARGYRSVRIMVTMPTPASDAPEIAAALLDAGTDLARINSAHDDPAAWRRIVTNIRAAAAQRGRVCPVVFDLAGPKLRTGPIADAPQVVRVRPTRDAFGAVVTPGRVRLVGEGPGGELADGTAVVPVDGDHDLLRSGDRLAFVDARGRRRTMTFTGDGSAVCERTFYLVPGTVLTAYRGGQDVARAVTVTRLVVGELPRLAARIELRAGEDLVIVAGNEPGRCAVRADDGGVVAPATIGCSFVDAVARLRVDDRVLIDDGTVSAVVREVAPGTATVRILHPDHAVIRPEKGINLPDTDLDVAAVTPDDIAALEAVVDCVDLVSLSFVQRPGDVAAAVDILARLGRPHVGLVLKIETQRAFEALPALLVEAMRHPVVAVMVARGDLAAEVGFERLAEVQEEILWLCEAGHVPVIWATQVLESLAKGGTPTRAEITDAASAGRAECVMLNKGPFVTEAVRVLDDVLSRMRAHQDKRTGLLRRLAVADGLDHVVARPAVP